VAGVADPGLPADLSSPRSLGEGGSLGEGETDLSEAGNNASSGGARRSVQFAGSSEDCSGFRKGVAASAGEWTDHPLAGARSYIRVFGHSSI
jgi:hypothetical protein